MSGSTSMSTPANEITAVAVGNFDGMHRGHRALFDRLGSHGGIVVIEHYRATLTPGPWRAEYADRPLFFYEFDRIRSLRPEAFIDLLSADFPALQTIVVGEDFRFGAGRSADVNALAKMFHGETIAVSEVKIGGKGVHSRHIRQMIAEGHVEEAATCLGRAYAVWGEVIKGQGIGAKSLVPTINLDAGRFLLPKAGVYKTRTLIGDEFFRSVTFVGHRHTTDGRFALETHLIDWEPTERPLWRAKVLWEAFLRENRTFESLEALKRQIVEDIEIVKNEK